MFMLACIYLVALSTLTSPVQDLAAEVSALIDGENPRAASARAEEGIETAAPNYVFIQAHAQAKRWAHVYHAAERMLGRVPRENVEFRVLLGDEREAAAKQLIELDVVIESGIWADGGSLAVALVEPDAPRPWTWTIEDVRMKTGEWNVKLSPGTWTVTLKTRNGEKTERVTIVRGERKQLRFTGPPAAAGLTVHVHVSLACLDHAATVRAINLPSERHAIEHPLPALASATERDFTVELGPGSYIFSLDGAHERHNVQLTRGRGANVNFLCDDQEGAPPPQPSLPTYRALWFSLGAAGVVGIVGAVAGGLGHVREQTAVAANEDVLGTFNLTGSFNYSGCKPGWSAGSACARAYEVEGKYGSNHYHHDLGLSLQLRGLGVGLGAAAIGVGVGALPVLARTRIGRKRWLIANGVLGGLTGIGGAVLFSFSHLALAHTLNGYETGTGTGTWRADSSAFHALARPWLAGTALVGLGGALLLNTVLVGLAPPKLRLRANATGLVLRF